jgi:hypothetical protein
MKGINYICHSGGCEGADMTWETIGKEYGIKTNAYSFQNHIQYGENQIILTNDELQEGYKHIQEASKTLKRQVEYIPGYVKSLLSRNWFQVKNSDAVFAIGKFINKKLVSGGTGWAVQMAVDNRKPVFFFDQESKTWNSFDYDIMEFVIINYVPKLTENFAGIGTREINDDGMSAIMDVFENTFGK